MCFYIICYYIVLYYTIFYILSHCTIQYDIISIACFYVISHYTISFHIILYFIISYYTISYHILLYYFILYYTILHALIITIITPSLSIYIYLYVQQSKAIGHWIPIIYKISAWKIMENHVVLCADSHRTKHSLANQFEASSIQQSLRSQIVLFYLFLFTQ